MRAPGTIDVFIPPGWEVWLPGIGLGHVVAGARSQGGLRFWCAMR